MIFIKKIIFIIVILFISLFIFNNFVFCYSDNCISITSYGAIGDGITDNTSFIQNAINSAEDGNTIFIPNGIYNFTQLNINKNLIFEGTSKSILKQNIYDGNAILIRGIETQVSFINLTFDGNNINQITNSKNIIIDCLVQGSIKIPAELIIDKCNFINQCHISIFFKSTNNICSINEKIFITNSFFIGSNEGNQFDYVPKFISCGDGVTTYINNNYFDLGYVPRENGVCGIFIGSTQVIINNFSKTTITNNQFNNCGHINPTVGSIDFYFYNEKVNISGNKLFNNFSSAIKGKSCSKEINISDNFIDGVINGYCGISINRDVYLNHFDNTIISKNMINNSYNGIYIDGVIENKTKNIIIESNILSNISYRGIYIYNISNCIINNNIFKNIGSLGIWIASCTDILNVCNNIFEDINSYAIYGDNDLSTVKANIYNNNIFKAVKYGIYLKGLYSINLSNNVINTIINQNSIATGYHIENIQKIIVIGNQGNDCIIPFESLNSGNQFINANNSWN